MSLPDYTITIQNHPKAKHVSLTVRSATEVVITKPRWVSRRVAEEVLQANHAWLQQALTAHMHKQQRTGILGTAQEYAQYKETARRLAHDRLNKFNALYNFEYNRVSIGNPKTRWGSCSSKGNLSFSYKIALLPMELADYVIVHELCHLAEMNHSKTFWNLVARAIPNAKECRRALSAY